MNNGIKHIALIPDGNYRFAQKKQISYEKALEKGAKKINAFTTWCDEQGIPEVTVWLFSTENRQRNKERIEPLFHIIEEKHAQYEKKKTYFDEQISEHKKKVNYSVQLVGNLNEIPEKFKSLLSEVKKNLPKKKGMKINFAINYGSRYELIHAVRAVSEDIRAGKVVPSQITEQYFSKKLFIRNDIDLVVRTGGEQRMSGFFAWQTAYAELFFTDKLWPEVTKQDFKKWLRDYQKRHRRYGR